ncbi:hypothetical protein [Pantoea sp. Morm]|uniref:hypothetical protein n=1 Tax=Pantoea sp. Morm TaxID=2601250 RepID=UPI0031FDB8FE
MKKIIWLLSLIPAILSIVTIRTYLSFFDNANLFAESLSVLSIFNFVFIFMILVIAAFAIIFFIPSVIFILSFHSNFRKLHNQNDLKRRISLSAITSLVFTIIIFFLWASLSDRFHAFEKFIGWFSFLISFAVIFLINYFSVRKTVLISHEYQGAKQKRETALLSYVGVPFLIITIISLFFAFSFAMVFGWVNTKMAGDNIEMLSKVALLVSLIGIASLFPGMVYVCTDAHIKNSSWHFKFGIVIVMVWPLLTAMYVPSFYPVLVDKTIALSGISDWKNRSYQVDEKIFPPEQFNRTEWKLETALKGGFFKVRGVMVYSLNGMKLLCPESIREPYKAMLRFVPWDHEYDKKMNDELKSAALSCQPFIKGGVSRLAE